MDFLKIKPMGNAVGIHLPSKIRQKIGIPEDTKFKIWRENGKIKLESVEE